MTLTYVDAPVLDVLWDSLHHHTPPLHALLVEIPDELVAVAVDARRPQGARVHPLTAPNLDRKQTLEGSRHHVPAPVLEGCGALRDRYLCAVGLQHHFLRLGFGDGVRHVVTDFVRRVLVTSEEEEIKGQDKKNTEGWISKHIS